MEAINRKNNNNNNNTLTGYWNNINTNCNNLCHHHHHHHRHYSQRGQAETRKNQAAAATTQNKSPIMSSILSTSAPPEVVVRILQYCDSLDQLRDAIFTCRRLYAVWLGHAPVIIWHVAPKVIPAFDQALVVARATALVQESHQQQANSSSEGTRSGLPPAFDRRLLRGLTGWSRRPTPSDLARVLDLHHLVRCAESIYCTRELPPNYYYLTGCERWPVDRQPSAPENNPEEPGEGMRIWRDRFHGAAYTSLLMGAVFARSYSLPFFPYADADADAESDPVGKASSSEGEHDDSQVPRLHTTAARKYQSSLLNKMRKLNCDAAAGSGDATNTSPTKHLHISPSEAKYLRQFAAYDLNGTDPAMWEAEFGPFAEWWIDSIVADFRERHPPKQQQPEMKCPTRSLWSPPQVNRTGRRRRSYYYVGPAQTHWPEVEEGVKQNPSATFTRGSELEGEEVLWLTMQSVHMFEFLLSCCTRSNSTGVCASDSLAAESSSSEPDPAQSPSPPSDADGQKKQGDEMEVGKKANKVRTAKVVLFGVFQPEEIVMPANVSDVANQPLQVRPLRKSWAEEQQEPAQKASPTQQACEQQPEQPEQNLDIPALLETLYLRSGIPNHQDGHPSPPPPLQFFLFLLRRYFDLQFLNGTFDISRRDSQFYHTFKNRATLFANGFADVGDGQPARPPGPCFVPGPCFGPPAAATAMATTTTTTATTKSRSWDDCTNGTEYLVRYSAPAAMTYVEGEVNPRTLELDSEWFVL